MVLTSAADEVVSPAIRNQNKNRIMLEIRLRGLALVRVSAFGGPSRV